MRPSNLLHRPSARAFPALVATAIAFATFAHAGSTSIGPDRDTTIAAGIPSAGPASAYTEFGFDNTSDLELRSLLHFDIAAAIPPGAVVTSARLQLTLLGVDGSFGHLPVELRPVLQDWTDGATWTQRIPPLAWTTAGGDLGVPSAAAVPTGPTGTLTWNSNSALVADVQHWIDMPGSNFGWAVRSVDSRTFAASRENSIRSARPALVVEWTDPCTATNYCVGALNSRGTSAVIGAAGSLSLSQNLFSLTLTGAVPNSIGFFFFGTAQQQTPWGNGFLCVDGSLFRMLPAVPFSSSGTAFRPLDFATNPGNVISAGAVYNFQCKYRDVAGGGALFNSSNGLSVSFCP